MIEIKVCVGSSCHLKGSYNLIQAFQQLIEEKSLHDKVNLKASFCMKQCQNGVAVSVKDKIYSVTTDTVSHFFNSIILEAVK